MISLLIEIEVVLVQTFLLSALKCVLIRRVPSSHVSPHSVIIGRHSLFVHYLREGVQMGPRAGVPEPSLGLLGACCAAAFPSEPRALQPPERRSLPAPPGASAVLSVLLRLALIKQEKSRNREAFLKNEM